MEDALHDMSMYREFAKLDGVLDRLPDESTILRFRHLLERHDLATDMLRIVNDLLAYKGLAVEICRKQKTAFSQPKNSSLWQPFITG